MATSPYPSLTDALVHLRIEVNDAIVTIGGQTITDTAAFTPYYVNRGYQMLQQELLQLGYVRLLVQGLIIPSLPAIASVDTALQASLSWAGYSDGMTAHPAIVLPQTLIKPTKLMERLSGASPNTNLFWDMNGPEQGITRIPSITKDYRNRIWVWNDDMISMPGATGLIDLRVDFASYLPDFLPNTVGDPAQFPGTQVVPVMRSTDALAWYIGYVFSYARNDDPTVCGFALGEARRAAAIIAGAKLPSQVMQAPIQ